VRVNIQYKDEKSFFLLLYALASIFLDKTARARRGTSAFNLLMIGKQAQIRES
jgi:hypothetical protein